jgi:hypothetical protein
VKKFLFALLIVMVGVFSLAAAPLHPPGEISLGMVLSDNGVVAMPATVLSEVTMAPAAVFPDSILAQPIIDIAGQPIGTVPYNLIGPSIHDSISQVLTNDKVILGKSHQTAGYFLLC